MSLFVCVCLQAIETFAVTVKEIAQLLQGFGSELSESELPDEASAIEFLLHSHTHRYRQMKVAAGSSLSLSLRHSLIFVSHFFVYNFSWLFFFLRCFRTISVTF